MSAARLATLAAAALFASGVSIDPSVRATDRAPRARVSIAGITREPADRVEAEGAAPDDVRVEVVESARGGHRVIVRRPGFLVALRHGDTRAAGDDFASMLFAAKPGDARAADRMVWETTRPTTLATDRGVVQLALSNGDLRADLAGARAPDLAQAHASKHATCVSHRDGAGGFTVVCRFAKGVTHLGAANVTGAHTLGDVWMTAGPSPVVRLDLARNEGSAEGRVIGFSFGTTGVALRAEATFPEGAPAALLVEESSRAQPRSP